MPRTTIENTVVAYLDNDDSPDITNPIHSTEVAKSYGFDGPPSWWRNRMGVGN